MQASKVAGKELLSKSNTLSDVDPLLNHLQSHVGQKLQRLFDPVKSQH